MTKPPTKPKNKTTKPRREALDPVTREQLERVRGGIIMNKMDDDIQ
ncbi:MAG: hypothetical protein K0V04_31105 [Deltaproteobacteria bacterium]|nr:hypothetical protein [Deltaproteobacteria bacterium]